VADDALFGNAKLAPVGKGLIIIEEDGNPEPLPRQAEMLNDELPGVFDSLLLKVVPDAEIASISKKVRCLLFPTDSISVVRKHFWQEVSRGLGAGRSPIK
jgi:hypothetical protein